VKTSKFYEKQTISELHSTLLRLEKKLINFPFFFIKLERFKYCWMW